MVSCFLGRVLGFNLGVPAGAGPLEFNKSAAHPDFGRVDVLAAFRTNLAGVVNVRPG